MHLDPVTTHGAAKITMNSKERDYNEQLKAAKAQADANQYVTGLQKASASFQQPATPANAPMPPPQTTSGNAELGTSATASVNESPDEFQTDALDRRLNMYAQAASNAGYGLNDRSQIGYV